MLFGDRRQALARPREFDETEVLEQAMRVFWENGYQPTTPQNLLDAMGLSKSSFYETFGSKRGLFLRCLQHYIRTGHKHIEEVLAADDVREAFGNVMELVVETSAPKNGVRCGCMVWNAAAELGPHDEEVELMVKDALSKTEKSYVRRLRRAQQDGQISQEKDAKTLAQYFVTSVGGLQLTAKADRDGTRLKRVVKMILSTLE